jgi:curved DNA-binding protein CbpA
VNIELRYNFFIEGKMKIKRSLRFSLGKVATLLIMSYASISFGGSSSKQCIDALNKYMSKGYSADGSPSLAEGTDWRRETGDIPNDINTFDVPKSLKGSSTITAFKATRNGHDGFYLIADDKPYFFQFLKDDLKRELELVSKADAKASYKSDGDIDNTCIIKISLAKHPRFDLNQNLDHCDTWHHVRGSKWDVVDNKLKSIDSDEHINLLSDAEMAYPIKIDLKEGFNDPDLRAALLLRYDAAVKNLKDKNLEGSQSWYSIDISLRYGPFSKKTKFQNLYEKVNTEMSKKYPTYHDTVQNSTNGPKMLYIALSNALKKDKTLAPTEKAEFQDIVTRNFRKYYDSLATAKESRRRDINVFAEACSFTPVPKDEISPTGAVPAIGSDVAK